MHRVPYYEKRRLKNGEFRHVVNPPQYVKAALNVGYESYDDAQEAMDRATRIHQSYKEYKRRDAGEVHVRQDTVNGLVAFYRSTHAYEKLKPASKRFYNTMIRTVCELVLDKHVFGELFVRTITSTHVDRLYRQICESHSDRRAFDVVQVMRRVWSVGQRHSLTKTNPWTQMGLRTPADRTILWEPEQVALFVETADEMGLMSIGTLALLCYELCQRPGDMRQLRWDQVNKVNKTVSFTQEKTGTQLCLPISSNILARVLDRAFTNEYLVTCETTGGPYSSQLAADYAAKVRKQAGLPDELQLRDLRRTGATEAAEAGLTEDELRSITGHKSRQILNRYIRPTQKLAMTAMEKRMMKHV